MNFQNINTYRWDFTGSRCPKCITCEKTNGVQQCVGCGRIFCAEDARCHRNALKDRLKQLIEENTRMDRNSIDIRVLHDVSEKRRTVRKEYEQMMQKVSNWEQDIVISVTQAADVARHRLQELIDCHEKFLEEYETIMAQQTNKRYPELAALMNQALRNDDFHDGHLKHWKELIGQRQTITSYINVHEIQFARLKFDKLSISKPIVEGECPEPLPPPPEVAEMDPLYGVIPALNSEYLSPNPGEFTSGVYKMRIHAESIFFGISSRTANREEQRGNSAITYGWTGWTGDDLVFDGGNIERRRDSFHSDFQMGDTFELTVDCDQRVISLTNERTRRTHKLRVDENKCPLPWLLNVRFLNMEDEKPRYGY